MIREAVVPDPDEAMADLMKENDVIFELDYQLRGDKLYRLVQLVIKKEDSDEVREIHHYLQVLDSPYETWKNHRIPASYWDETAEFEVYKPREVLAVEEDRLYLHVSYSGGTCYLGVWSEDGSGGLLSALPEEVYTQDMKLVIGDGKEVGAYQESRNSSFLLLDEESEEAQIKSRISIRGKIVDVLRNPQSGELLWYGYDEDWKTGIWRMNDNAPAVHLPEGKGDISLAAYSDGGVLYLANDQELWRCDEKGEPESLFRFFDLDYPVEALYGMSVQAEDTLFLRARYEGKDHILQVTKVEGAVQEKTKIILATLWSGRPLEQAVAKFNRRNPEYRVEIIEPEDGETGFEFMDRIQREMLAGDRGPDLFLGIEEKAEAFAENGYLQEVSDLLPEEGTLWQAALENGVIQGRQYGIPYECFLRFATYSRDLTGGRDSWTLEEMMEAVRNSDVEVLQAYLGEVDLVLYYGLLDNDNKSFIDWEKGESHLNEAPFLDFLAFAKEYSDKEKPSEDPDTRLQEGKVAALVNQGRFNTLGQLEKLVELNELEGRFQGKPAYIGYPRAEGNGIYVYSQNFYVSSQTKQREGCRAFLNFVLSEEMQKDYADLSEKDWGTRLPVRLSALEYKIQSKKREKDSTSITWDGIEYRKEGLSEEQEAAFRFLLENARPQNWYIMEVGDMVYEELQPYFAGQRTAEDAAGILNRRIQVYLDERK